MCGKIPPKVKTGIGPISAIMTLLAVCSAAEQAYARKASSIDSSFIPELPRHRLSLAYRGNKPIYVNSLADTGASIDLFHIKYLDKLGIKVQELANDGVKLTAANTSDIKISGTIKLNISCLCTTQVQ